MPQHELSVREAAHARRSIRKYTDQAIPREDLETMLDAARKAPSPWNLQPWRVIVVTDDETKQKLKEAAYGQIQVGNAAAVFVIATDMDDVLATVDETIHPGMPEDRHAQEKKTILASFDKMKKEDLHWWGRAQGYTFMAFLMLTAQSMGYVTSGMLGFDPEKVKELFGLSKNAQIPALVAMGVADQEGFPHHRHELARFVTFIE